MTGLRILHLFANYKWTGPGDPAIRCAQGMRARGHDLRFAQAAWTLPAAEHRMAEELWRARLPVLTGLELRKHFRVRSLFRDVRRLRARLEAETLDVLHCHLLADHLLAVLACHRFSERPIIVRSLYDPDPPGRGWRNAITFRATDGVVVPTRDAAARMQRRFGLEPERILYQDPPTDPGRSNGSGDLREHWGVSADEVLVGITARIQPHRRFDLLWEVARRVVAVEPHVRFVLLGRGNDEDTDVLVRAPVARLGLDESILLPGYLYEPDYSRALRSLDVFLFLVPGSDGTCRAVREAMAFGMPVVASERGILPELLAPDPAGPVAEPTGTCCPEDPDAMAAALLAYVRDRELRRRHGAAARARALTAMDPVRAAAALESFYRWLLQVRR